VLRELRRVSLRILVVEDNALNRELVEDLLVAGGHHVECAVDGAAFYAWLRAARPVDLVVMDVGLPDSDGVTLLGALRRDRAHARVPAVAVTAHAFQSHVDELRAAGFDAVLTKPIDTRSFVDEMERAAGKRR